MPMFKCDIEACNCGEYHHQPEIGDWQAIPLCFNVKCPIGSCRNRANSYRLVQHANEFSLVMQYGCTSCVEEHDNPNNQGQFGVGA